MIYTLSKLFTALFLPPGLFATAAFLLGLFRCRRLFWGLAATIYLLSVHPVADLLLAPFETPYRQSGVLPEKIAAVVSLGGGMRRGDPLALASQSLRRHLTAANLAAKKGVPLYVSGSEIGGDSEPEALKKALKALSSLINRPIKIVAEGRSLDTYENVRNLLPLLSKKEGAVVLVTSAYHMRRALCLFRSAGVGRVVPLATDFHVDPKGDYRWPDYLPSIGALLKSYLALHEFFGYLKDCLSRRF